MPLVAYLGAEFLVYLTRIYVHRPRPSTADYPAVGAIPGIHETSASFPSGHATAATAVLVSLAGLAVVTWDRWWPWIVGGMLVLSTALSRLVLGVHWFSDVTFGLAIGVVWGVVVTVMLADAPWPFGPDRQVAPPSDAGLRPPPVT
jgi:membrane-associated phospholipid phosphatase